MNPRSPRLPPAGHAFAVTGRPRNQACTDWGYPLMLVRCVSDFPEPRIQGNHCAIRGVDHPQHLSELATWREIVCFLQVLKPRPVRAPLPESAGAVLKPPPCAPELFPRAGQC